MSPKNSGNSGNISNFQTPVPESCSGAVKLKNMKNWGSFKTNNNEKSAERVSFADILGKEMQDSAKKGKNRK